MKTSVFVVLAAASLVGCAQKEPHFGSPLETPEGYVYAIELKTPGIIKDKRGHDVDIGPVTVIVRRLIPKDMNESQQTAARAEMWRLAKQLTIRGYTISESRPKRYGLRLTRDEGCVLGTAEIVRNKADIVVECSRNDAGSVDGLPIRGSSGHRITNDQTWHGMSGYEVMATFEHHMADFMRRKLGT